MKDTIYYIYQKYFQRNILQSFQTFFSTILFLQNTIFNINKLCRIKRPENDSCILARFSNGNAVVGRKCLLATCCRAHGTWRVCVPRASYVVILHFAPCICHERVSLRRPFEYASTPLSFIIHYFAVFIAPIGYYGIYIYSISISRVSTTYFHDAGARGGGKEVEKRCGVWIVSGNFNGWKPNFFLSFLARFFVPSC